MTATPVIPSLSTDGWVSSPEKILDLLISYYILTDYRQTYLYAGNLLSLAHRYHKTEGDPDQLASQVSTDLRSLLGRYFTSADVSTRVVRNAIDTNVHTVLIAASVISDAGKRYELNKITQLLNSKAKYILDFNNYGAAAERFKSIIAA
jgi:hypothetical protein